MLTRVWKMFCIAVVACVLSSGAAFARAEAEEVIQRWYKLVLELVRHTPTYSPPVASRAFAYLGVTAHESLVSRTSLSLAGQLNGLEPGPRRDPALDYDDAIVLHTALLAAVEHHFSNTGPTGKRALKALQRKLGATVHEGVSSDIARRSEELGTSIANHILAWSIADGASNISNMGFPGRYDGPQGKSYWIPTSLIQQQQTPLLPEWGVQRTFAMPDGATCNLPPPPEYSEAPDSEFFRQAREVIEISKTLTPEQELIARFWSDDPMLSPTPPGHWISIALQQAASTNMDAAGAADMLARLGVALADAFIGCWHTKYEYDLLRPVTYINRVIDQDWKSLLITPPFPEYPSGHSTQSGAAAEVLTAFFGEMPFTDHTHKRDAIPSRSFPDFRAAAEEAAMSRLYGGIHFRAAVERGLEQGRCVGAYAIKLKTRAK